MHFIPNCRAAPCVLFPCLLLFGGCVPTMDEIKCMVEVKVNDAFQKAEEATVERDKKLMCEYKAMTRQYAQKIMDCVKNLDRPADNQLSTIQTQLTSIQNSVDSGNTIIENILTGQTVRIELEIPSEIKSNLSEIAREMRSMKRAYLASNMGRLLIDVFSQRQTGPTEHRFTSLENRVAVTETILKDAQIAIATEEKIRRLEDRLFSLTQTLLQGAVAKSETGKLPISYLESAWPIILIVLFFIIIGFLVSQGNLSGLLRPRWFREQVKKQVSAVPLYLLLALLLGFTLGAIGHSQGWVLQEQPVRNAGENHDGQKSRSVDSASDSSTEVSTRFPIDAATQLARGADLIVSINQE